MTGDMPVGLSEFLRKLEKNQPRVQVQTIADTLTAAQARNILLGKSDADVVAFIDSDDCWHKEHLSDFAELYQTGRSIFYFTDYQLRQAGQRVAFSPVRRNIGYLIKQPILLSSVVLSNRKEVFQEISAEDFAFCYRCLTGFDEVIHNPKMRVVYDQKRTQKKSLLFRLKRTFILMDAIFKNKPFAAFLTVAFIGRYVERKLFQLLKSFGQEISVIPVQKYQPE